MVKCMLYVTVLSDCTVAYAGLLMFGLRYAE